MESRAENLGNSNDTEVFLDGLEYPSLTVRKLRAFNASQYS